MFSTSSVKKSWIQGFFVIAIIPVSANVIGTVLNIYKNPTVFLILLFAILLLVDVILVKYLMNLRNVRLTYAGVEVEDDRFYTWDEVNKINFFSNGQAYISFNSRKSVFTLLNYMENNFPEFFKEISLKTNAKKFNVTGHPFF